MNTGKKVITCVAAVAILFASFTVVTHPQTNEPTIQGHFVSIPTNESKTENMSAETETHVLCTTENSDKPTKESSTTKVVTKNTTKTTSTNKATTIIVTTTKKETTTTKSTKRSTTTSTTKKPTTTSAKKVPSGATYLGRFKLTFYCGGSCCNGKWAGQPTASGAYPRANHTIAVDPRVIPLGTWVNINGFGTYKAEDTGSDIKGNRIDVFVSSHSEANRLGVQYADVYITN